MGSNIAKTSTTFIFTLVNVFKKSIM